MIRKPKLDLSNVDGNAISVVCAAAKSARKAGWTEKRIACLRKEALSGDYDHVLRTCMDQFDVGMGR